MTEMSKRFSQRGFAGLGVLFILSWLFPLTTDNSYIHHLLALFCIYSIFALSLDVLLGRMGELPFGHVAFWGLGGYGSALLAVRWGWPVWATIILGSALATLVAFLIGLLILRLRRAYFAIITLGFSQLLLIICINWTSLTGGPMGLINIPPVADVFRSALGFYYLAVAVLWITVFIIWRIFRSPIGRAIVACRENENLAAAVSVNVVRYRLVAFCVGSFFAGLAGALNAHYIRALGPSFLSLYYTGIALIMVVAGGRGTIAGPILGAAFFTIIPELLRASGEIRMLVFGIIMILIVLFLPQGLWQGLISLRMLFLWKKPGDRPGTP
jgi:branched-chain amino acid transport system permease protein